jgi:hypothetical protein
VFATVWITFSLIIVALSGVHVAARIGLVDTSRKVTCSGGFAEAQVGVAPGLWQPLRSGDAGCLRMPRQQEEVGA